jgi:hypothetical protein
MRRATGYLIALAMLTAGCGSSSSSNAPSATPLVFTAHILPSNELFNIQGGETSGSGDAQITFNVTKDSSGSITAANATFNVQLVGFPTTTAFNLAHIHTGGPTVNGGIVVSTGIVAGDVANTNGTASFTKANLTVDTATMQQIINNPAGFYFNVHTSANPSGVARAQLVRIQ